MKSRLVVTAYREHHHPARPEVNRVIRAGRVRWLDDPGGTGPQIVREQRVCPRCATRRERGTGSSA